MFRPEGEFVTIASQSTERRARDGALAAATGMNKRPTAMNSRRRTRNLPLVQDLTTTKIAYERTRLHMLDQATSSSNIMVMERASSRVIATSIAAGDFRSAGGGFNDCDWGRWTSSPATTDRPARLCRGAEPLSFSLQDSTRGFNSWASRESL
jgi:hypothetical protein